MFVFPLGFFTGCISDQKSADSENIALKGYWSSGLDELDLSALEQGIQWQLAGLGLLPADWALHTEYHPSAGQWWIEIHFVTAEQDSCLMAIAEEISFEWPFAVQLSQLTQNPYHVAYLTEQPEHLSAWDAEYGPSVQTLLSESLIVDSERVVSFVSDPLSIEAVAYKAYTLAHPEFVETIDVMPNGRLRYGQYQFGEWIAESELGGVAGCQWCHEGKLLDIQPQVDIEGYAPYFDFANAVLQDNAQITAHHDTQYPTGLLLDLSNHANGEKLVEHYLYPNLQALSVELNLEQDAVLAWLEDEGIPAIVHAEYPEWGEVFARTDINAALGLMDLIPMTPRRWNSGQWPPLIAREACRIRAD